MSSLKTKRHPVSKKPYHYCCNANLYYKHESENLVKTFKITPRVVIHKKCLKFKKFNESVIKVTNNGLHQRFLTFSTDCADTTIRINPEQCVDNFLQPEKSLQIIVRICPKDKESLSVRRNVYIDCRHPNIRFAIPIIVLTREAIVSLPTSITFPSTIVSNFVYYDMVVYNMSQYNVQFNIKSNIPSLSFITNSSKIQKRDYAIVLLKLDVKGDFAISGVMKIKATTGCYGDSFEVLLNHIPMQCPIFVDTLFIKFDTLRFNRSEISEFIVCNESNKDVIFQVNFSTEDFSHRADKRVTLPDDTDESNLNESKNVNFVDKYQNRHFQFKPECGTIQAHSSSIVQVIFKPVIHKDFAPADTEIPPFMVATCLAITTRGEFCAEKKYVALKGYIDGPEIDLSPKIIDLRRVYFGEEQCANIKVTNLDDILEARVKFYDLISSESGQVLIKPTNGLTLKPLQSDTFKMRFYSTDFGNFMMQLEFKVENGGLFSILLKGHSQQVRIKCYPETVDLSNVPIAIPQKRLVLLTNPLSVPLTVQCTVSEDGYETPLILNVSDVNEHLPINVNDPVYQLMKSLEIELYNKREDESRHEFEFRYSTAEEEISVHSENNSVVEDDSSYSTEFEELALDKIPTKSHELVARLKNLKVLDKLEGDKYVVDAALKALLETPYFKNMDEHKNYLQMDWSALATDPKEIYCNHEIIRIKPNTAKVLTVIIIPNMVGFVQKYIDMRVCPLIPINTCDEHYKDLSQIVDTNQMVSKLWIKYNCCVPEVIWDNVVIMQDELYAEEYYEFEMSFINNSNIGGFFYYDVVPNSHLGVMKFRNNRWKYFIEPGTRTIVPCKVKFKKTGFISLAGLIKFVGVYGSFGFQIRSEVLPPKVTYSPMFIVHKVNILEFTKFYLFIENATPTTTWFRLKLKDESVISIEPEGAQLAPTGQIMYVTFNVFYRDPGIYKNTLYIIMEFKKIEKVPVTLHVKGMPIFFEPEIRNKDLDFGYILCNTEEDYIYDRPNYSKMIKVINKGLRPYRITITRTKSTEHPTCHVTTLKAKITIKPINFIIQPLSETYFSILLNSCEALNLFSEYRIDIADLNDISLAQSYRATLRTKFLIPELAWSRREITMNYYRTHKHKEQEQWEIIKLINVMQIAVESVNLKVNGPFKIKELFEHPLQNELNFSMAALETKQFFIVLDKTLIRNRINRFYYGSISCCANSRLQKSVSLKVRMFIPDITLTHQQVTLFAKNKEGGTYIEITNTGDTSAIYKWKKLHEEWHHVIEDDDCKQAASVILSEILKMVEIQPSYIGLDSKTNMTLYYQKYKCYLKGLDDPIDVKQILYDIIDNIDLTARRYRLCIEESPENLVENIESNVSYTASRLILKDIETEIDTALSMPMSEEEYQEKITRIEKKFHSNTIFLNKNFPASVSSCYTADATKQDSNDEVCTYYTLDHIVDHLKLEDSYVLTPASSETCDKLKSVYFFEKCGILQENEKQFCPLHIPAIRRGYEVRATFQLDIVGGHPQDFEIILVNIRQAVVLGKDRVYLGLKPWYESYRSKVYIQNVTKYDVYLNINKAPKPFDNLSKIANGYLNIVGDLKLHLKPCQIIYLETEGIMGFNEQFKRELRIVVNDGEVIPVSYIGHGTMPMLRHRTSKLKPVNLEKIEIIEEYVLLQKIYYFDIFKGITEMEDECLGIEEDEQCDKHKANKFGSYTTLTLSESAQDSGYSMSSITNEKEINFYQIMQTYVIVHNNEDLPNIDVLDQLLQTEKFLNHLRWNKELNPLLNLVYQYYLQHQNSYDAKMPTNLKHFNIQPLPFQLRTYILDMGNLYLNQYRKIVLQFEFMGPGKLIAACRSAVKIPGLVVDFGIVEKYINIKKEILLSG